MHIQKPQEDTAGGNAPDELPKKPAWMATTADEYDNGQTRESQDEEESEVEVGDGSSDEDVQVSLQTQSSELLTAVPQVLKTSKKGKASASKGRGKGKKSRSRDDDGTGTKGDSRGRAMLRELPKEVRLIVTRANMFLRLYICLEKAWTEEKKTGDAKLPNKHTVAKQAISDVWKLRDDEGKPYQHFDLGFKILNRDNNEDLRNDVFSLVSNRGDWFAVLTVVIRSGPAHRSCAIR